MPLVASIPAARERRSPDRLFGAYGRGERHNPSRNLHLPPAGRVHDFRVGEEDRQSGDWRSRARSVLPTALAKSEGRNHRRQGWLAPSGYPVSDKQSLLSSR